MEITKNLKFKKGIYLLMISDHKYVGSSKNLYKRLYDHYHLLSNNKHYNTFLQRSWNKYSGEFIYSILEYCDNELPKKELLLKEKYYIKLLNADLNLKKDPTTEKRCITIIKPVYQFDLFGNFIKRWDSITDAAEFYGIDSSNITHVCNHCQAHTQNFLWSYEEVYPYDTIGLYVYDSEGKLIGMYNNTVEIYENLFLHKNRKTVLSQLKKKINSGSLYDNIYISTDSNFKPNVICWYKKDSELLRFLNKNPKICCKNECGEIIFCKPLNDIPSHQRLKKSLIRGKLEYKIIDNILYYIRKYSRTKSIYALNCNTNEVLMFKSIRNLINVLFDKDMNLFSSIEHHIYRKTKFKNYLISRTSFGNSLKSRELLEHLEDTKTETELETTYGIV